MGVEDRLKFGHSQGRLVPQCYKYPYWVVVSLDLGPQCSHAQEQAERGEAQWEAEEGMTM